MTKIVNLPLKTKKRVPKSVDLIIQGIDGRSIKLILDVQSIGKLYEDVEDILGNPDSSHAIATFKWEY